MHDVTLWAAWYLFLLAIPVVLVGSVIRDQLAAGQAVAAADRTEITQAPASPTGHRADEARSSNRPAAQPQPEPVSSRGRQPVLRRRHHPAQISVRISGPDSHSFSSNASRVPGLSDPWISSRS